ncbi:MAG: IMP cyclohydrolase [Verrucomicrobiota bacterium]|nr:IMP cyclohydrolase [Verrucomicrobiota bacterium]
MQSRDQAFEKLKSHIRDNPYPGRGLVIGRSHGGDSWQQVYFIMGRSPNSRNRQFKVDDRVLETQPFDASKVEDPSLIIYEAMLELDGKFLVSNGDQTRTALEGLRAGNSLREALSEREREPDAPNYTPRITGMLDVGGDEVSIALSILKANRSDPTYTDRCYYYPSLPRAGEGYALTTYMGDGNPLPSFEGDPLVLPMQSDPEETLELYWDALDTGNRISLAVKEISATEDASRIIIRNKYQ